MSARDEMTDEFRYYLLRKRRAEDLIVTAFREFRKHGIEPILIKGWAAARNYPDGVPRFFGDIDLAVAESDFAQARQLIDDPSSGIGGIDLHRELRHLDTLNWDNLFANSELVEIDGEPIRILSAEDHLRVMCVHWLNNGGESRDRLWDIVYAVRNRPENFEWSRFTDVVSPIRRKWLAATIRVAHKYLGLELDGIPFADEATNLPAWFTRCIEREWERGVEIRALEALLRNPKALFIQIRKRIPPNPIQATIACEAPIDETGRVRYQVRDFVNRLGPSLKRISAVLLNR